MRSPLPALLLLTIGAGACPAQESPPAPSPRETLLAPRVLNIAHRGGGGVAPEQTLVAFEKALDQGADVLELDVHATKDGKVVVCHDPTVDRTSDGSGRIRDMRWGDLRKLDAGHQFTRDGKSYPFRGKGVWFPTLAEVVTAFPRAPMLIEIKQTEPPIVEAVIGVLEKGGALRRVILASMDDQVVADVRKRVPGVLTGFARMEAIRFVGLTREQEAAYRPPAKYLQIPARFVTRPLLERARRWNLKIHAWTVNDGAEMKRLIDLKVDGIITDFPKKLANAVVAKPAKKFF